jgi:hypothetical protein
MRAGLSAIGCSGILPSGRRVLPCGCTFSDRYSRKYHEGVSPVPDSPELLENSVTGYYSDVPPRGNLPEGIRRVIFVRLPFPLGNGTRSKFFLSFPRTLPFWIGIFLGEPSSYCEDTGSEKISGKQMRSWWLPGMLPGLFCRVREDMDNFRDDQPGCREFDRCG